MRNRSVEPQLVSGSHIPPQSGTAGSVNEAHNRIAVDGRGNGLPETELAKPFLLSRDRLQLLRAKVVLIENHEVIFEAGAHVGELGARTLTFARQQIVVFRTQAGDHAGFARLETHDLCV